MKNTLVGKNSIYTRFKARCIEYSGDAYYQKVKDALGVKHLKDLEKTMSLEEIEKLLTDKMNAIDQLTYLKHEHI